MGEVYRARDKKLGRDVAIKVLPSEFSHIGERLERFEREARLLASLNHPGIATLHGLEEAEGVRYLVMELVEGETLEKRIEKGALPIEEVVALSKQIAEALEAAHESGVIHRDLKPANIIVTPDGKVKILDFGLAKAWAPPSGDEAPTVAQDKTRAGVILGTAAYMSPEQARAQAVDKRTDIWAFGCVLYEMLTGKRAFPGAAVADICAAVARGERNWGVLPASTPSKARDVLRRCLQKDAHHRLRDIGDARIELDEALNEPGEAEESTTPVRSHPMALVAMTFVAVVATGLLLWSLTRSTPPRGAVKRVVIPLAPAAALARNDRHPAVAISPDGEHVAYVAGESSQLYLRSMDEREGKLIDGAEDARAPFFSPDSQWVGYHSIRGKLMRVSVSGGAPVTIEETGTVRGSSWSSDGWIVSGSDETMGLTRVSPGDGAPTTLTIPNRDQGEKAHRYPEVLPGDVGVLFTVATGDIVSWDDASIAVLSLPAGEYQVVLEGGTYARYSATGHIVYARAGSLFAVPFDLDGLHVTGPPVRVLDGVTTSPFSGNADFCLTRDGSLIYAPGGPWSRQKRVVVVNREGRSEPLIETAGGFVDLRISPDGRQLALEIEGANESLWVYDIARTTLTRLAFGFDNQYPIWTADGGRVTFTSNRAGKYNLFWRAADGSEPAERLTESEYSQQAGSWSPDGSTIVFQEERPKTGWDLWIHSGSPVPFLQTRFDERLPIFSPDGRFIAYESNESGQFEIYVRPFPASDTKWQVSTGGGRFPLWSADGRELFYRRGSQMLAVGTEIGETLALGKPEFLFDVPGKYDVMPDGKHFVIIVDGDTETPPRQLNLVLNWSQELERLEAR